MGNKLSFEIEIKTEKGTPEYTQEMYEKMGNIMKDFKKGLLEKPKMSFALHMTSSERFRVDKIEQIHEAGYCTVEHLGYYKTEEYARRRVEKELQKIGVKHARK